MNEQSPSLAAAKLSPFLSVRRGRDAVDFYKRAFGAYELFRFDAEDGTVVARLAIGQSEFWLSDESPEQKNFSPETLGGGTMHIVIVVDDPDAVYDYAIAAGATSNARCKMSLMAGASASCGIHLGTPGKSVSRLNR